MIPTLRLLAFSALSNWALIGFLRAVDGCWLTRTVGDVHVCARHVVVSFRVRNVDVAGIRSRIAVDCC